MFQSIVYNRLLTNEHVETEALARFVFNKVYISTLLIEARYEHTFEIVYRKLWYIGRVLFDVSFLTDWLSYKTKYWPGKKVLFTLDFDLSS